MLQVVQATGTRCGSWIVCHSHILTWSVRIPATRPELLTQPAKPQCQELGGNEAAARAVAKNLLALVVFPFHSRRQSLVVQQSQSFGSCAATQVAAQCKVIRMLCIPPAILQRMLCIPPALLQRMLCIPPAILQRMLCISQPSSKGCSASFQPSSQKWRGSVGSDGALSPHPQHQQVCWEWEDNGAAIQSHLGCQRAQSPARPMPRDMDKCVKWKRKGKTEGIFTVSSTTGELPKGFQRTLLLPAPVPAACLGVLMPVHEDLGALLIHLLPLEELDLRSWRRLSWLPAHPSLESQRGCVRIWAHTASETRFALTSLLIPFLRVLLFVCDSVLSLCGMLQAGEEAQREIPEYSVQDGVEREEAEWELGERCKETCKIFHEKKTDILKIQNFGA
ncbi:hypothetical protein EK904_009020, partial [Melospiza melodia maxima]